MGRKFELDVAGEKLVANSNRTLFWPKQSALFVADIHLGKDTAMVSAAIPVPMGSTHETLDRLTHALVESGANRLIMLGDLWHAKAGRTERIYDDFLAWRRHHCHVSMLLIEGNHDLKSGKLGPEAKVDEVPEAFPFEPFTLCHIPQECSERYVLSGHIHPGVVMEGKARQAMKLPCFWFGPTIGVLPAFGQFTGSVRISPTSADRVLVVADNQICDAFYPVFTTT